MSTILMVFILIVNFATMLLIYIYEIAYIFGITAKI
jgi:hypothetical protein